ncbi:zinc ribbon domain-containing protein [uncultured Methylobacterium sp.]|uniref:zinc ribbon domain-containing protein n=1 Tax=uncultured Methylobacterium sp. TaxID=157278 RepID=UPI00338D9751
MRLATILTDKMAERGGQVVGVPARFMSQTCAAGGVVDARSCESQARFVFVTCGHTAHADINAAIDIARRWSTPLRNVEGLHRQPCETSTGRGLMVSENPRPSGRGRC